MKKILALMMAMVVILLIAIVVTAPKNENEPVKKPTASSSMTSEAPSQSESISVSDASSVKSSSADTSKAEVQPASEAPSQSMSQPESAGSKPQSKGEAVTEEGGAFYEADMPILVNPTNKIPADYKPDVTAMGNGYSYDRRALAAYNAMNEAAKADGIGLWVVSAYRTTEKQTTNFNNKIKEFENMGYNAKEAYAATAKIIAVPGTSEHSLGLALDLNSLETSFEDTKTFKWLVKHCAEYGFILRYPKDKTDITEITYEPWHYRYVGSNHAKIIMDKGICLEEYLSGDY